MSGLEQALHANNMGHWNLSELNMQPDVLMAIIPRLPLEAGGDREGTVTLDLSSNRLGTLTVEQLRQLVRALKERPWLQVRLGHEVMPARVREALEAEGFDTAWGGQVCVDRPWDNPTNKLLGQAMTALMASTQELTAAHKDSGQAMAALIASTKELTVAHKGAVKDMKDSAAESDANNRGISNAWEHQMATGVAELVQGQIVAVSYKWAGSSGELIAWWQESWMVSR